MTGAPHAAGADGELVLPDYGGHCLDGVLGAAAAALGCTAGGPTWEAARVRFGLPVVSRVCVVLVDGMGLELVEARAGHAPFLRRRLGDTLVLTSGFPSTTAVSMGVFGTGRGPGRTGLAGYSVRNPATGALANLVSWEGAGAPEEWQPEPSVFSLLRAEGYAVSSVGPASFDGSGLTRAALRGARYLHAEDLADRVDAALGALAVPGLVYLYWGEVDRAGHQHGWRSAEWGDALGAADAELGRLARSMPAGTLLLVTADHGFVDVDHDTFVDVATTPALAQDVELVAGEPRASHVHVAPGTVDAVLARWRGELGDRAVVLPRAEAEAAGWFGPVTERVRPMIGDLVVAARGRAGVVDSRTQTPHSIALRGMHGSLTPTEMRVPLVVVA